jgi:hypothetical protein
LLRCELVLDCGGNVTFKYYVIVSLGVHIGPLI